VTVSRYRFTVFLVPFWLVADRAIAVDYRAEKDCVFFSINGNLPGKNPKT
jgi:hypothetical protein